LESSSLISASSLALSLSVADGWASRSASRSAAVTAWPATPTGFAMICLTIVPSAPAACPRAASAARMDAA
jgi:hypothetical protein